MSEATVRQGMEYFQTKEGLPFFRIGYRLIQDLVRLSRRIEEQKPSLFVVDGPAGAGKSTLMVHCADIINRGPINLAEQLSRGGEDFQIKLQNAIEKGYKVLIYDEAGDFSKKGTMSRFNRNLEMVFDTFRTYGIIVIIGLPLFTCLDKHIFENRVCRMLVHCDERKRFGKYHAYSLEHIFWLMYHAKKETVTPSIFKKVKAIYWEYFGELPAARQKELDKLSTETKKEIIADNIAGQQELYTTAEITKMFKGDRHYICTLMRDKGIKAVRKVGVRNYYSHEAVGELAKHFKTDPVPIEKIRTPGEVPVIKINGVSNKQIANNIEEDEE